MIMTVIFMEIKRLPFIRLYTANNNDIHFNTVVNLSPAFTGGI